MMAEAQDMLRAFLLGCLVGVAGSCTAVILFGGVQP